MAGKAAKIIPLFFLNATATTEISTLSLHDALPIWLERGRAGGADISVLTDAALAARRAHPAGIAPSDDPAGRLAAACDGHPRRSEERRVGKECRSRWSPDQ